MKVSIVVAVSDNNAIGAGGTLLWHLPKDMQYFKQLTWGHHVLMGRKTWESLPEKFRPLPGRVNIVVTRQKDFKPEGCLVAGDVDEAIAFAKNGGETELMVIGGGEIYKQIFDKTDKVYLTRVHATFIDADTFSPELSSEVWKELNREEHAADEKHQYAFEFIVLERGNAKLEVGS